MHSVFVFGHLQLYAIFVWYFAYSVSHMVLGKSSKPHGVREVIMGNKPNYVQKKAKYAIFKTDRPQKENSTSSL